MTIKVRVTANARSARIIKSGENSYAARVNAPAINRMANDRLIEILSEYFGIPKSRIRIYYLSAPYKRNQLYFIILKQF